MKVTMSVEKQTNKRVKQVSEKKKGQREEKAEMRAPETRSHKTVSVFRYLFFMLDCRI